MLLTSSESGQEDRFSVTIYAEVLEHGIFLNTNSEELLEFISPLLSDHI